MASRPATSSHGNSIPNGWRLVRLGDVAEVVGGSTPSRKQPSFWGGAIPWVVPSELTELQGRYLMFTREYITNAGLKAAGLRVLPAKSVLLTSRATIGTVAINALPTTTNQGFQNLIPNPSTESLWLYYSVSHNARALQRRGAGSTFLEVSRDSVRSLPILLPPLPEQRAIAKVLDSIDEAIEATESVVAATEQLRGALLHRLLTRGVPGWHTELKEVRGIGTIPADWDVVRLGEVAVVKSGTGFPLQKQGRQSGVLPFIKVSDMNLPGNEAYIISANNYIEQVDADELGASVFPSGTIVFPKVGAAIATNKKRVLTAPTIIDNNLAGVTVASTDMCDKRYLHCWFESIDLSDFANVSAVPSITGTRLKRSFLPLPSLLEQEAIASMLDSVDEAIALVREETQMLQSLKASAADALLTGRVRVGV